MNRIKLEEKSLWVYIAYTLLKLFEKQPQRDREIKFGELRKIIFDGLPCGSKLLRIETPADLYVDLLYLEMINVTEISGKTKELDERIIRVRDEKKLSEIAKKTEELPSVTGMKLFEGRTQKIEEGIASLLSPT